jgi:hypothetical protein
MDLTQISWLLIGLLITLAILLCVISYIRAKERERLLRECLRQYELAIYQLKRKPDSSELRQSALDKGRILSRVISESGSTTVFDEVALKNDLDAATAAVHSKNLAEGVIILPDVVKSKSTKERLEELQILFFDGLITEQDYQSKRKSILDEI